jgi:hypothetical protein
MRLESIHSYGETGLSDDFLGECHWFDATLAKARRPPALQRLQHLELSSATFPSWTLLAKAVQRLPLLTSLSIESSYTHQLAANLGTPLEEMPQIRVLSIRGNLGTVDRLPLHFPNLQKLDIVALRNEQILDFLLNSPQTLTHLFLRSDRFNPMSRSNISQVLDVVLPHFPRLEHLELAYGSFSTGSLASTVRVLPRLASLVFGSEVTYMDSLLPPLLSKPPPSLKHLVLDFVDCKRGELIEKEDSLDEMKKKLRGWEPPTWPQQCSEDGLNEALEVAATHKVSVSGTALCTVGYAHDHAVQQTTCETERLEVEAEREAQLFQDTMNRCCDSGTYATAFEQYSERRVAEWMVEEDQERWWTWFGSACEEF